MNAQLQVLNGPLRGAIFPLPEQGIRLVGQCQYSGIQLPDRALDTYQCAFVRGTEDDAAQYVVIDLHSQNGTRVNDVSVTKAAVSHGSVITAGETSLRFEVAEAAGRKPSPVPPKTAVALLDAEEREQRREKAGRTSAGQIRAEIVPVAGIAGSERIFADPAHPVYVGRARGADVLLTDPGASRHQCVIAYDPAAGQFILYDLRTTNGTVVNDERVDRAGLSDRDVVQIGAKAQFAFLDRPARKRLRDDPLGETRDLSQATMLVRPGGKRKRGRRPLRRLGRELRPKPVLREDDTGLQQPAPKAPSASEKDAKAPAEQEPAASAAPKSNGKGTGTKSALPVAFGKSAKGVFAEAYRTLRTNLDLTTVDGLGRCIVVTSPGPQEGKTSVAVNLGIAAAKVGLKVVLLEGDLRRSRLHRVFLLEARPGLVNYLAKSEQVNGHVKPTHIKNLAVLPRGSRPANPGELLHSAALADLLEELREEYDLIIVDTPPVLTVSDAAALSPLVDGYLLVVRSGETPREAAQMAVQQIERVQGTLLGVVLNDLDPKSHNYPYYHYMKTEYSA